jgi:hypothetical protein
MTTHLPFLLFGLQPINNFISVIQNYLIYKRIVEQKKHYQAFAQSIKFSILFLTWFKLGFG